MSYSSNYKKVGYLQYDEYHLKIELYLNIGRKYKDNDNKIFTVVLSFYHGNTYEIEITPKELLNYLDGEISTSDLFKESNLCLIEDKFFNEENCQDFNKIEWLANILK